MSENITIRGQVFEICECGICGVTYFVSRFVRDQHRKSGGYSFCPNGHQWGWTKEMSEDARVRRERDLLKQQLAQKDDEIRVQREMKDAAERSAAAARGQVTKLKKRTGAGVCPCRNRTFLALQRHMTQKHPQFTAENVVPLRATEKSA